MLFCPIHKKGLSLKLMPRWDGPFRIIEQINRVTYKIQKNNKITTAHVQRLKIFNIRN